MSIYKHFPCGHWHKGPSKSLPNVLVGIAPMYGESRNDSENGIALATFNAGTNTWIYSGQSNNGSPNCSIPNTLRLTDSFAAYYGGWYQLSGDTVTMRLHIFENAVVTTHDLWTYESYVNTFYDAPYNAMDVGKSGLVACLANVQKVGGVDKNDWAIKVSEDKGIIWKNVHYFNSIGVSESGGNVRIDKNETIWVAISNYGESSFMIFKSVDKGNTWTEVCTKTLGKAVYESGLIYTMDSEGVNQYIYLCFVGSSREYALYKSEDSGATWNNVSSLNPGSTYGLRHSSNGEDLVIPYYSGSPYTFKKSVNSGSSFSDITPPYNILPFYIDMQREDDNIVYTECGQDFDPGALGLGFMYSLDAGTSWKIDRIPNTSEFNDIIFTGGSQQSVDIISI